MRYEYRIHPSVGIARMGNSDDMYFVGREYPEDTFEPEPALIPAGNRSRLSTTGNIRDTLGKLAKQAARFRIFCYEYDDLLGDVHPQNVWEVTSADYDIEWKVKVANLKSWSGSGSPTQPDLPNAPSEKTLVTAPTPAGQVAFGTTGARLQLGSAFLDSGGQLLVLGSNGVSRRIPQHSNVSYEHGLRWWYWEDDAADGYVKARVMPKATSAKPDRGAAAKDARTAWVVIGMPNYGLDTPPAPSLFDVALSHALHNAGAKGRLYYSEPITYFRNIKPIIQAYVIAKFVSPQARQGMPGTPTQPVSTGHRSYPDNLPDSPPPAHIAAIVFAMLRKPWKVRGHVAEDFFGSVPFPLKGYDETDFGMPKLLFLAYPEHIYQMCLLWTQQGFLPGSPHALSGMLADDRKRAMLIDMAHMGWMSGGSFFPGLEVGRRVHHFKRWTADYGTRPDHVDVRYVPHFGPGEMTRDLGAPWQEDFRDCNEKYWPMSRPIRVKGTTGLAFYDWLHDGIDVIPLEPTTGPRGQLGMLETWWKLGFMRHRNGEYLEDNRTLTHP